MTEVYTGDVTVPTTHPDMTLHMTPVSAEHFRNIVENTGALVVGRRLFDLTDVTHLRYRVRY